MNQRTREEPCRCLPPDWDWGRDVRPGMLFRIDANYLRVGSRRGPRASPSEPDPDDVLRLCRAVGRGAAVALDMSDPATLGCLTDSRG